MEKGIYKKLGLLVVIVAMEKLYMKLVGELFKTEKPKATKK